MGLLGLALLLGSSLAAAPQLPRALAALTAALPASAPLLAAVRPLLRAVALHGAILSGYFVEPVTATLACAYSDGRLRTTALGLLHAARTLVPTLLLPAFGAPAASHSMEWVLCLLAALAPLALRLPGLWHSM